MLPVRGSLRRGSPTCGDRRPSWLSSSEVVAALEALGLCFALAFLILHSFPTAVFLKIELLWSQTDLGGVLFYCVTLAVHFPSLQLRKAG